MMNFSGLLEESVFFGLSVKELIILLVFFLGAFLLAKKIFDLGNQREPLRRL